MFPLRPIVYIVERVPHLVEQVGEQQLDLLVEGGFGEVEGADVLDVLDELLGEALAEVLRLGVLLHLRDLLVLLRLRLGLEPLPRELPAEEVEEHVDYGLQVVAAGLLDAQMRVDRRVASSADEVLLIGVLRVASVLVAVPFGEPEVNHVDLVALLLVPHQEVVRLDVAVDVGGVVHVLDARDHLRGDHQDCLERELLFTLSE